ncbi:protein NRT1/ PTR FAMILY 5.5-like [Henckelia pumila]|uniref:protein NRT1/ PTR FAMILY 5.5-like n=1 Tax=Henckelia pumila TaxID=405737 RepID=UPI003C6E9297
MKSFVRISSLLWADILVGYALFVVQNYLTDVWNLDVTHAAGIVNIWGGICKILPLFFLFLVDAFLGNFKMLVISSVAYSVGIGFISMSTPPVLADSTGTCKEYESQCIGHTQKALFYTGMALVAVGMSGNLVSVQSFLKEQNEGSGKGNQRVDCLRILGFTLVAIFPVVGAIALPYIKPWSLRFGIPAICTAVAMFMFFSGWCTYTKLDPQGSPITNVCRVFVASASNISVPVPLDARELYNENDQEPRRFTHTRCLRCLEKAAIRLPGRSTEEQAKYIWRVCKVSEVEEAKIAVRMVPMWLTFIVIGIVSSITNTYFVEQANHLNRKIGKWNVPLPIFMLFFQQAKAIFSYLYTKIITGLGKYAPPSGIALAMILSVLCCITAAKIEKRRLNVITKHDLLDKPDDDIPMSIYWLLFQFFLLAGVDSLSEKGIASFYDEQSPESMKNYLIYFTKAVSGLGFMLSVVSVYVVGKISEKGGRQNWFQPTLNRSRLDRYYWVLAGLSSVNFVAYIVVACCYRYKQPQQGLDDEAAAAADGGGGGGGVVSACFSCCS